MHSDNTQAEAFWVAFPFLRVAADFLEDGFFWGGCDTDVGRLSYCLDEARASISQSSKWRKLMRNASAVGAYDQKPLPIDVQHLDKRRNHYDIDRKIKKSPQVSLAPFGRDRRDKTNNCVVPFP